MHKLIKNLLRKGSAATVAATLALASVVLGLVSSPSAAADSYSFTRCVQDKKAANVLVMMDESGSVYESDPNNLRIAGAEVLVDRLQRVADTYADATVNVMLAGFGDDFVPESTGKTWVPLQPGNTAGSDSLVATARNWANKTPNMRETDTLSSLYGATKALADAPSNSCKLLVFFKDGLDFQSFNNVNAKVNSDFPGIQKQLDAGKKAAAEKSAIDEICRKGGVADALRVDDNIYTFGVALNTNQGGNEGLDAFRSLIAGGGTCGTLPAKGRLLEVNDSSNLPSLFGSALDPDFVPSTHTGPFTVNMPRALTSINILSSGISSTFDDFTITLPKTCSQADPIKITKGTDLTKTVIGGSVTASAKWAGADPAQSQTLNITVQHTDLADDKCWVGAWTINPGSDTMSELYFDADLSAVATFAGDSAVLVKQADGKASLDFNVELQRPSDKSVIPAGSLDPDLDFTISGYLRNASTKERVASTLDTTTITKATVASPQHIEVNGLDLGDYELVLTMEVRVKDFTEKLSPISTEHAIKIGTPAAAPTITGVTAFGNIDGANRKQATVTFVGSKDADFELSIADMKTQVNATQFPKDLEYEIFLPAGAADNIKIPKGQTVQVPIELGVKLADGKTDVNAQGFVRGNLLFAAKAVGVQQDVSQVKGEFSATQLASANLISQLLWTILFMLIGVALPVAALIYITVLLSRFPDKNISGNVTSAAFNVQYSNGEVTNVADLTNLAADLSKFGYIDVAEDRKSATVGMDTFSVKVNPFGLKAISHAELSTPEVGANSAGDGKPYMSLNLGSEWIFYTGSNNVDLFADSATGSGTIVLVVSHNSKALTAPELMADFLRSSSEILKKLPQKSSAGIIGGDSSGFDFGGGSTTTSSNNGNSGNDGFVGI